MVERIAASSVERQISSYLLHGILGSIAGKEHNMGWYLKKSVAIGPLLRLNLSKSGMGASVGVKGLRVSTGPRGRQLNAGREGLYYRASLNSPPNQPEFSQDSIAPDAEAVENDRIEEKTSLWKSFLRGLLNGR